MEVDFYFLFIFDQTTTDTLAGITIKNNMLLQKQALCISYLLIAVYSLLGSFTLSFFPTPEACVNLLVDSRGWSCTDGVWLYIKFVYNSTV